MYSSAGRNHIIDDGGKLIEKVHYQSGASIDDIMKVILQMHKKSKSQTVDFSKQFDFNRTSGFRKLWQRIKRDIDYVPDKLGYEVVKAPRALWRIGKGDCKSFAIASATTMENAGVKVYYDLVHYGNPDEAHIYPVAILDDGEEVIMDSVHHTFNKRHPGEKWRMRFDPVTSRVVERSSIKGTKENLVLKKSLTIASGLIMIKYSGGCLGKLIGGFLIYYGVQNFNS